MFGAKEFRCRMQLILVIRVSDPVCAGVIAKNGHAQTKNNSDTKEEASEFLYHCFASTYRHETT
ncbi:MAG: hypothetical protein AAFP67_00970 [Pseudomonadota bacterium]